MLEQFADNMETGNMLKCPISKDILHSILDVLDWPVDVFNHDLPTGDLKVGWNVLTDGYCVCLIHRSGNNSRNANVCVQCMPYGTAHIVHRSDALLRRYLDANEFAVAVESNLLSDFLVFIQNTPEMSGLATTSLDVMRSSHTVRARKGKSSVHGKLPTLD